MAFFSLSLPIHLPCHLSFLWPRWRSRRARWHRASYRAWAGISLPSLAVLAWDGAMRVLALLKWGAPNADHHGLGMVPLLWHGEEVSKCRCLLQRWLNAAVQTGLAAELGVRISPEAKGGGAEVAGGCRRGSNFSEVCRTRVLSRC